MGKYNISEHRANIEGVIIDRNKSAYVRDSAQRYSIKKAHSVPSQRYTASSNNNTPIRFKSAPIGSPTPASYSFPSISTNNIIQQSPNANSAFSDRNAFAPVHQSMVAERSESFQKSSPGFPQSSAPTATVSSLGETQINTGLSDVRESGEKYTCFNSELSYQYKNTVKNSDNFDEFQDENINLTEQKPKVHKPNSNGSRYFRNSKEKADRVSFGNRYLVNSNSPKIRDSTKSRLDVAGVSSVVTSSIVSFAKDESNGGQVVSESVKFTETAIRTAGKVRKAKVAKNSVTRQATKQASKKAIAQQSAQATLQGAKAGRAVVKGASKIPLPILIIIIVVIIVMLFLFMIGGLVGTSCSGSLAEAEQKVGTLTDPGTKNSTDLVLWVKNAEETGWGYVYGAFGQFCTMEYLIQQAQTYPGDNEAGGAMFEAGKQWLGVPVADCIGLIKSYAWYNPENNNIEYGSNGFPDCGANSIWNSVKVSGAINTMPETPGLAVWKNGHIGVYIGDGEVIEAMGTEYGVVKTKLANGGWTKWLQIPNIIYKGTSNVPSTSTTTP